MSQLIKSVAPWKCPHCEKEILIVHSFSHPTTEAILTRDNVKEAKKDLLAKMEDMTFKDVAEKKLAINWVNDDNTLFGPSDVEQLAKTMAMSQLADDVEEKDDNKKNKTK